jgi:hypothetical protein
MRNFFLILPCLCLLFQPLNAKVDPPNYDFSLESLSEFFPTKQVSGAESKYGKAEIISKQKGMQTLRFNVGHLRYNFAVLVQEKDGVINDFFARLPTYFLHDIFLQSLVKRLGKQTIYKRIEEEAFYVWKVDGKKHVYSAACTITCFPIFYSVAPEESKNSLLDQMRKASLGK